MKKYGLVGLAAMLATAIQAPASAQNATVFKPSGQWSLDYGEDYCRLMRSFSAGDKTLDLAFERIQPGPMMRMIMVSNGIRAFRDADEIGWSFGPAGGAERKTRYTKADMSEGKTYFNFGPVTMEPLAPPAPGTMPAPYDRAKELASAKPLELISLGNGLIEPVRVETGSLEAPMGALQACTDDLIKTWNVDPARMGSGWVPAIPEGGGAGWLPQGTIPFTDFVKLSGGSNQVRLMVDATGKPTSCHIHFATLGEALNGKVCAALMSKAKFTPAKDAEGNAMASYWIGNPMFLGPPMGGGRR